MEGVTAEEYPDLYTQSNNSDEGIPFLTTNHFEAAEECLRNEKESENGKAKVLET